MTDEPDGRTDNVVSEDDAFLESLGKRSNFKQDFMWAYAHIGNDNVQETDAPNTSAWFLREFGRHARVKFLEMALRVFAKKDEKTDKKRAFKDDGRTQFKRVQSRPSIRIREKRVFFRRP